MEEECRASNKRGYMGGERLYERKEQKFTASLFSVPTIYSFKPDSMPARTHYLLLLLIIFPSPLTVTAVAYDKKLSYYTL